MENLAVEGQRLEDAEARGRVEGREEEKLAMAKKMLAKGKDLEEIIEFTELSKEEIVKLKS